MNDERLAALQADNVRLCTLLEIPGITWSLRPVYVFSTIRTCLKIS